MRINKFIAGATGLSRRAADRVILDGRITMNGRVADLGAVLQPDDEVKLDGHLLTAPPIITLMLNKPAGYVCSRHGQGSRTVYDLLPAEYHSLKPVGRLDKDSSGLLLLTNDGDLANCLTHPRYTKTKIYEIGLDKPLSPDDQSKITNGINLDDGPSKLTLDAADASGIRWQVAMTEGRNRQIRRTFAALGYTVANLHRTRFGPYDLGDVAESTYEMVRRLV